MLPVPTGARVPVHRGNQAGVRPGNVVMAHDVLTVQGYAEAHGQVLDQVGRGFVLRLGVPGRTLHGVALVLDADRVQVRRVVARVEGHVLRGHHLGHRAVGGPHHVIRRRLALRVLEGRDGGVVGGFGVMDEDGVDPDAVGISTPAVVAHAGVFPLRH